MTKNGDVLSLDLMTERYLAESMRERNEGDRRERVQRRNALWNLTNNDTRIMLFGDERARKILRR